MDLTGTSLIAGSEIAGDGPPWRGVAAATGEPIGPELRDAAAETVSQAVTLAAAAARQYRSLPLIRRAAFLDAIAEEIEGLGDGLIELAVTESGLPTARLTGERARTCAQLRLFADVVRRGDFLGIRVDPGLPDRQPLPRPDLRLRRIPLGPVAVFGASNFPLAFSVAGGDTASALAAGCPVIAKGHPAHPGTSELVARAVTRAAQRTGMPAGVFSFLVGRETRVGQALANEPQLAAVGFTGSRSGGLALMATAAARRVPIPVYAEMSSVNPVIVLPGALADPGSLAAAYVGSLTLGAGQFCTNPGLLFLPAGPEGDAFLDAVAAAVRAADGQVMLTEAIADAYTRGSAAWAGTDGVTTVAAGPAGSGPNAPGSVVVSTDAETFSRAATLAEEVFGAAGLVVRWSSAAELLDVIDGLDGQLTATLHGTDSDLETARTLLPALEDSAGRILWGGWPTGVEVTHAMVHGGPFPATSAASTTSVGTLAIDRWLRPVAYQQFPEALRPDELRDNNPLGLTRRVDGVLEPGTGPTR